MPIHNDELGAPHPRDGLEETILMKTYEAAVAVGVAGLIYACGEGPTPPPENTPPYAVVRLGPCCVYPNTDTLFVGVKYKDRDDDPEDIAKRTIKWDKNGQQLPQFNNMQRIPTAELELKAYDNMRACVTVTDIHGATTSPPVCATKTVKSLGGFCIDDGMNPCER